MSSNLVDFIRSKLAGIADKFIPSRRRKRAVAIDRSKLQTATVAYMSEVKKVFDELSLPPYRPLTRIMRLRDAVAFTLGFGFGSFSECDDDTADEKRREAAVTLFIRTELVIPSTVLCPANVVVPPELRGAEQRLREASAEFFARCLEPIWPPVDAHYIGHD